LSAAIAIRPNTQGRGPAGESPAYLAHDARNWLTVLQVYCDLLRSPENTPEETARWAAELAGAVDRGQSLLEGLLHNAAPAPAAAGTSAGQRAGADRGVVELGAALRRRLPVLRHMAGAEVQIELHVSGESLQAWISEAALDRILQNLVMNAVEAMHGRGRIVLGVERAAPGRICLRVTDSGPGVPRAVRARLFQPGVSVKAADGRPHGFGLAIVRELAEAVGGQVSLRSGPGVGTCFAVKLRAV
jgi:signal transduction histidine kinase